MQGSQGRLASPPPLGTEEQLESTLPMFPQVDDDSRMRRIVRPLPSPVPSSPLPPKPTSHVRTLALLLLVVACAGAAAFVLIGAPKHCVFFENPNAFPVALTVDGKPREAIPAHGAVRLELSTGAHKVSAKGADGYADSGALTVVPRGGSGFRGLYAVGAHSRLAIVSKAYGKAADDHVERVPESQRFVELPAEVDVTAIDQPFPETVMVRQGTTSAVVVHLCHADPQWRPIGCWRTQ
jgi:hypothetical protein